MWRLSVHLSRVPIRRLWCARRCCRRWGRNSEWERACLCCSSDWKCKYLFSMCLVEVDSTWSINFKVYQTVVSCAHLSLFFVFWLYVFKMLPFFSFLILSWTCLCVHMHGWYAAGFRLGLSSLLVNTTVSCSRFRVPGNCDLQLEAAAD